MSDEKKYRCQQIVEYSEEHHTYYGSIDSKLSQIISTLEPWRQLADNLGLKRDGHEGREVAADIRYARRIRKGAERAKLAAVTSFFSVVVPAGIYIIWQAFKDTIKR